MHHRIPPVESLGSCYCVARQCAIATSYTKLSLCFAPSGGEHSELVARDTTNKCACVFLLVVHRISKQSAFGGLVCAKWGWCMCS